MAGIIINHDNCIRCDACINACPFNALEIIDDKVSVNSACKLCKVCINTCPVAAISLETNEKKTINKEEYKGILVYVEHDSNNNIHPVVFELIGKAKELAQVRNEEVSCLYIGHNINNENILREYGVDKIYIYDYEELKDYKVDIYTNIFEDLINKIKPSSVLVGSSVVGRSLAPSIATRFKTGLTADTTSLEMREDSNLIQIRPAFGGNIMAQIITDNSRPQFATVRYKVMDKANKVANYPTEIIKEGISKDKLISKIEVLNIKDIPVINDISDADIIVAIGMGVKDELGLNLCHELAKLLNANIAYSRPMVEKGIGDNHHQIGLSGRTVKAKLVFTIGISGAIQFVAGMQSSDMIIALNSDKDAPIFKIAHYGIVGDLYEILPKLIDLIKEGKDNGI